MKKIKQFRQGDVFITRVTSVPVKAVPQQASASITVALGEATGHHHTIYCGDKDPADWWKDDSGDIYITTKKAAELRHQEHSALTLEAGTYQVKRQREYSPAAIRNVAD